MPFPTSDDLIGTLIRFVWLAGLVLMTGAVVFRELVLPRVPAPTWPDGPRRLAERAALLGGRAAILATLGLTGRLALQVQELRAPDAAVDGDLLRMLIWQTTWGRLWLAQVALAIAAWRAFARARGGFRTGWTLAAAMVAGLAVTAGFGAHAAGVDPLGEVAILADAVHLLVAGGWAGGLAALFYVVLWPRPGVPDSAVALLPRLVHAFSPVALGAAGTLALTGVIGAWFQLGGIADLWQTRWGVTLLIKLGFVAMAAAFGAWNWRRISPMLHDPNAVPIFRRSAWWELTAMTLALMATAVLVAMPLPSGD